MNKILVILLFFGCSVIGIAASIYIGVLEDRKRNDLQILEQKSSIYQSIIDDFKPKPDSTPTQMFQAGLADKVHQRIDERVGERVNEVVENRVRYIYTAGSDSVEIAACRW